MAVTEGLTSATTVAISGSGVAAISAGGIVQLGLAGAVGGGELGGGDGGSTLGAKVQLKEQPTDRNRVRIIARKTNIYLIFILFMVLKL